MLRAAKSQTERIYVRYDFNITGTRLSDETDFMPFLSKIIFSVALDQCNVLVTTTSQWGKIHHVLNVM